MVEPKIEVDEALKGIPFSRSVTLLATPTYCAMTQLLCPHSQTFLKVNGPLLKLPKDMTKMTTATTIIHLATPELQVVLDPLLYLKSLPHPKGIPNLIHMTMKNKHQLAPHQILSMLSWGRFNKGYTLLVYDNDDIAGYMQQYFPGFIPSKQRGCYS